METHIVFPFVCVLLLFESAQAEMDIRQKYVRKFIGVLISQLFSLHYSYIMYGLWMSPGQMCLTRYPSRPFFLEANMQMRLVGQYKKHLIRIADSLAFSNSSKFKV